MLIWFWKIFNNVVAPPHTPYSILCCGVTFSGIRYRYGVCLACVEFYVQPFSSPLSVSHAQVYLMTPVITNYAPHSMNTHTICFTLFHILTCWMPKYNKKYFWKSKNQLKINLLDLSSKAFLFSQRAITGYHSLGTYKLWLLDFNNLQKISFCSFTLFVH